VAGDKRIDVLRSKIVCVEDPAYTRDYHDPAKRSIANALTIEFKDGKQFKEVVVEYPIGHARRRQEGIPLLEQKFKTNLRASSRRANNNRFWMSRSTRKNSKRCQSTIMWICM